MTTWPSHASTAVEDPADVVRLVQRIRTVVAAAPTAPILADALTEILRPEGIEVVAIRVTRRDLARRFASERLTGGSALRGAREWQPGPDGTLLVGLRRGNSRILGALVLRVATLDRARQHLVAWLAEQVAGAAADALADEAVTEARGEAARLAERDRLGVDARADGRDLFGSMRLLIGHHRAQLVSPPPYLDHLDDMAALGQAKQEWVEAAVELLPSAQRTLRSSLRGLTEWVGQASGVATVMQTRGRVRDLDLPTAWLLYRCAYQCLTLAAAAPRCTWVGVELAFGDFLVDVMVEDDALGVDYRPDGHARYAAIERALIAIGGSLTLEKREQGDGARATASAPSRRTN